MDIKQLINECAETTKAHGFNVSQHVTQLLLIATEISEAIDLLKFTELGNLNFETWQTKLGMQKLCDSFEEYRREIGSDKLIASIHHDHALLPSDEIGVKQYCEELADILIRLMSYVGGNDMTDKFIDALTAKMEYNKTRPYKHGKAF